MAWYRCTGGNGGGSGAVSVSQVVNKRAQSRGDAYDSSMFYISGKNGTDFSEVLWTYTATEKVQICFGSDSQAKTNTSRNEGYIAVVINNTTELKQTLTADTLVNLTLGDYEINSGDTISLVAGFNNSHTNCWWQVYTAICVVKNALDKLTFDEDLVVYYKVKPGDESSGDHILLSTDGETWDEYYYADVYTETTYSFLTIQYASPNYIFRMRNGVEGTDYCYSAFDDNYYGADKCDDFIVKHTYSQIPASRIVKYTKL